MDKLVTNDYILIKRLQPKNTTVGGLVLPDKLVEESRWGVVVDTGEGVVDPMGKLYPPEVNIGDLVYFTKHAPELLDYTDKNLGKLYLIAEGDIMLRIKKIGEGITTIPMGNYVQIEELEDSVKRETAGGILLPDQALEKPTKGRVLAVGSGQRTLNGVFVPRVNVGDIVRYRKHSTLEIKFDGVGVKDGKTYIIGYRDILLIETEEMLNVIKERIDSVQ